MMKQLSDLNVKLLNLDLIFLDDQKIYEIVKDFIEGDSDHQSEMRQHYV